MKEGTENRGSIEAVVRLVRKTVCPFGSVCRMETNNYCSAAVGGTTVAASSQFQAEGAQRVGYD